MKKIILGIALFTIINYQLSIINSLQAQQFSLPIWPEKVWPSEYANYNTDVHNCCDWLLNAAAGYNEPKREECTNFLIRWLAGSPEVRVYIVDGLVDPQSQEMLVTYMASWTRHALDNPDDSPLLCANVAVNEMLDYYEANSQALPRSKYTEKLLKMRSKGKLSPYIHQCLTGEKPTRKKSKK